MWNPSRAEVAEILALKKSSPVAAKHIDDLLTHLGIAARKIAYYETLADAATIAKAADAGFAGMTAMEKATFATKAAGGTRAIITADHRLVPEPTPAEREALAKRAPFSPPGAPTAGGMATDPKVLAAISGGRDPGFRPAGMVR